MAASLGGAAAGANGGRNQALDAFDARCRRAMEARRYNEQAQRDLDAQRLEMRRLELEEQRRRQQFALEDERMKLEVERLQGEARRSRAIAESLRGCQQKDPKECLAACRLGASSGCASLGFMFARGDGVALDKDAAVSAFQAACNLGDSVSCQRVGASPPATTASHKIMVFGGTKHDVYLGCFCDASASDSVFNESGKFGKQGINVTGGSLWGITSEFRRSFGDTSACNSFAIDPPVIVLDDGTFVGRLTLNATRGDAHQRRKGIGVAKARGVRATVADARCRSLRAPLRAIEKESAPSRPGPEARDHERKLMAESKDSLPTAGDNDADANPEGMTATEWDTFVGEHLAKREAERAAAHEEEVEALRRQPIAKVARRLADNFAHFVEALEHPDTSPEDRALYGSWVLHVASADWNDAPPQNTKLDHLFRSIHLGEVLVKHGYWRIYIRRPRGEPVPHVPCRRGYGVVARWYRAPPNWRERATAWRADKLAHAARFVVKDFAAVFPYDAAALDLTHLAVALDEWTTPGSDRKKRGGRRANRVGKFNALEDAIAETSFAQKAASLEVRYAQWRATKRVMKSKA